MVRYQDDEDDSGRALLIAAGVISGLLAGAVVAHRYGGWRGIRRALTRRRTPLLAALRAAIPSKTFAALLDAVGIDELIAGLLTDARRPRGRRQRARVRAERRLDPDLDEYEVEDFERAAAGLYDDEDDAPADPDDDYADDEEEDEDEVDELVGEGDFDADLDADPSELDLEEEYDEEDEPADTLTPEALEDAVLAAFRRHPLLRQRALQIAVDEDGVAELTGWVRRERDVRIARRVAAAVPGIERVVVDVAVRDVSVREVARVVSDVASNGA